MTTRIEYETLGVLIAETIPGMRKYKCPICNGTGQYGDPNDRNAQDECPSCVGYGYLWTLRQFTMALTVPEFVDTNRERLTGV